MKSVFITGIPTAGKSYLAKKVANELGITHVHIDDLREELENDPLFEPWVNFYWKQDEAKYFQTTSADEQWQNLVRQSDAFWPKIQEKITEMLKAGTPVIFEGVNLLPHLMQQTGIQGIVILGSSEKEILSRLALAPRWGDTEALQHLEAHAFFTIERPRYREEAERFGLPVFEHADDAEATLVQMIQRSQ